MALTFDDLRELKGELIKKEIEAKEVEVAYGKLKIEEAERNMSVERSGPHDARVLTFAVGIDTQTAQAAIRTLAMWSRETPGCDMTVIIDSPGGSTFESLGLYDFIRDLRARGHKMTTKVIGKAFSGGAIMFQAGTERVMSPNAFLMIHESADHVEEDTVLKRQEIRDMDDWNDKIDRKLQNIFLERSNMTRRAFTYKIRGKDWALDAEEALKYGFCDRIEA